MPYRSIKNDHSERQYVDSFVAKRLFVLFSNDAYNVVTCDHPVFCACCFFDGDKLSLGHDPS